ncbi:GMP synthase (glutamine-hydrolysing) [Raineyella antarctica]|uniref:GMP synthase (Glutamine-hydrolysing) n=1 Tax=Raineyella antarctica TaxID=1577474 RepID=A0A1G6GMQ7_9ACTN|nr:glutamine amidotransferase [Raineyella antarctica]SDB83234.1 GMP synthase (glutamine-hydrolysing) [Raineyella antarctica]
MRPFLLLATRAEDGIAEEEFAAFARLGGLKPGQLDWMRLDRTPLETIDLDAYSGIVLGGSPFNSSDPVETKSELQLRVEADLARVLDDVVEQDFPFLGACYGIGTLGSHQGAVIDRTYGEPVGPVTVELTLAARKDPVCAGVPSRFEAFVGHKEAVRELPASAVLLATSDACPVQMFRVKEHVYATQFHPELDADGLCTRIEEYKHHGYFEPHESEDLKEVARRSPVPHARRFLRNFFSTYARD